MWLLHQNTVLRVPGGSIPGLCDYFLDQRWCYSAQSGKTGYSASVENMGKIWNILGEQTDLKNEKKDIFETKL